MTDKEIYQQLVNEETQNHIILTDDDQKTFELEPLGIIPLHGVIYAVLDLLKIEGQPVSDEDGGIVMLELDYDEEEDEYFVSTVDDDELFDEVITEFEKLPEK
ncbi:MAG: DUF1292 domain-containing protein [Candidatus Izemoplasmatales bacterium]|jgi:hypothetical protein|nr:DUF1292 domain-containing protein [Candidatus Izemoplasmatales bacterium]NLF48459.1 DUF1292 domain-containing protein [Acholeplasmataceae bacterium]MDD4354533.1 DUF1292 domain-containing protein [Candidatus Izemoplasmatales bacterium]MDD4987769.1 DUF1292 domain-containing protein [Candidatus Izemoplasmatales bacterium]MDD5601799.1 DUF1292 domain-containing protein [Candidatus Izemoplasmatales bacterium]